jgi:hypothetical protein
MPSSCVCCATAAHCGPVLVLTLCALSFLAFVAAALVHEGGHLLAIVLLGGRVVSVGVGDPHGPRLSGSWAGWEWYVGRRPWLGAAVCFAEESTGSGPSRIAAVLLAGPAATLLSAGMVLWVAGNDGYRVVSAMLLLHTLANVLPWPGSATDGAQVRELLKGVGFSRHHGQT